MATETASPTRPAEGPGASVRTIAALWREAAARPRSTPAYLVETEDGWREVSWQEAARRVDELAHGLLSLGVKKGDAFSIASWTRIEWALLDFALLSIGAIVVPLYPTSSPKDCEYILAHSEAVGIAVEDDEQLAKIETVRGRLPQREHVLTFADLDELAARGRRHAAEHPNAVEEAARGIDESDVLTYVYTSGTTGPPKGCVLTHKNYYVMTEMCDAVSDFLEPSDILLLYLPLAHTFGRLVHFSGAYVGFTIAFCPDIGRLSEAMQQVRPTILPSVPRVYEKVHTAVLGQFGEATGVKRKLIDWSMRVGREGSLLRQQGRPLPPLHALQYRLADKLVYSKVKAKLGGRLRLGISGAAPLAAEIAEFFHALGILIVEGYGQTECTAACSVNRPDRFQFGTVGPPMPGCEVRIAEDGEILVRGENVFAGYLKDEEATRAALPEDGWLHTGDVGEIDADGFLKITDRKRDIIVTAGGKNISPQNIEKALKTSQYVSQAVVVGDRRPYIAALIALDEEEVGRWARARNLDGDVAALAQREEVRELVQGVVDEINRDLGHFEQVRRFAILPRDLSQEAGELTPTLKMKRRVCEEHFASEIEALYAQPR